MANLREKTKVEETVEVLGPTLSRRQFVKTGGALVVGFSLVGPEILKGDTAKPSGSKNSLDPSLPSSWIEIHPDNTILIRTEKNDFGQGSVFTAYRQIVADELSVPFEAITTVVQGTPISRPTAAARSIFSAGECRISARRLLIRIRRYSISPRRSSGLGRISLR